MELKLTHTKRGFACVTFKDRYGIECSLQASSLAEEAAVWLGCDEPNARILEPEHGWQQVHIPGLLCDTRMHLTQEQVKALLPMLQHFAETGNVRLITTDEPT